MRLSEHQYPEQSTGYALIFEDCQSRHDFLTYLPTALIYSVGLSRLDIQPPFAYCAAYQRARDHLLCLNSYMGGVLAYLLKRISVFLPSHLSTPSYHMALNFTDALIHQ